MTTTITYEFRPISALADADSVVFTDPTNAYGLIRTDTSAIIIAAGTALNHVGVGLYSYSFADPADGLDYDYWIKAVYGSNNYYTHLITHGSSAPEAITLFPYPFTSQEEIERLYSTLAVNLRLDDLSTYNRDNFFNDLINAATSTVASYTLRYYNNSDLVNSAWVRRRATIIAAYYLSMRRANGTQFGLEYQRIIEDLEKFLTANPPFIPNDTGGLVPIRSAAIPTVSRQIVDDRYRTDKLRRVPQQSTKPYPGEKDYTQPFLGNQYL